MKGQNEVEALEQHASVVSNADRIGERSQRDCAGGKRHHH